MLLSQPATVIPGGCRGTARPSVNWRNASVPKAATAAKAMVWNPHPMGFLARRTIRSPRSETPTAPTTPTSAKASPVIGSLRFPPPNVTAVPNATATMNPTPRTTVVQKSAGENRSAVRSLIGRLPRDWRHLALPGYPGGRALTQRSKEAGLPPGTRGATSQPLDVGPILPRFGNGGNPGFER